MVVFLFSSILHGEIDLCHGSIRNEGNSKKSFPLKFDSIAFPLGGWERNEHFSSSSQLVFVFARRNSISDKLKESKYKRSIEI